MSTFLFKSTELKTDSTRVQECLDALKYKGTIKTWNLDAPGGEPVLSVETLEISSEELKHLIRGCGIDVEFAGIKTSD